MVHAQTIDRLPKLAEFIARNLLFVDHVALMGLEITGFTRGNLKKLWIDPYDYRQVLEEAVEILSAYRVPVKVYNHQLCVVTPRVREFCVQSISDWKNEICRSAPAATYALSAVGSSRLRSNTGTATTLPHSDSARLGLPLKQGLDGHSVGHSPGGLLQVADRLQWRYGGSDIAGPRQLSGVLALRAEGLEHEVAARSQQARNLREKAEDDGVYGDH